VTLDFRMSTTCVYSDIVLPTATWYEKNDLNTSDMHPFIHPLSSAADPAWEARSDWDIFKGIAKKFSEVAPEDLGVEKDVVLVPILHDTPANWPSRSTSRTGRRARSSRSRQDHADGRGGRARLSEPLQEVHLGRAADGQARQRRQGHRLEHRARGRAAGALNGVVTEEGVSKGMPRIETDIDATEVILTLAPETNGEVAVKAWEALSEVHRPRPCPSRHSQGRREDPLPRHGQAQPRKIISSPTWSGIESEKVCYNAGYTNVHELIPWRTLTGRQQLYQDHLVDAGLRRGLLRLSAADRHQDDQRRRSRPRPTASSIVLNFITPHQKWGIHSTYSDNLLMLTLNRGGPVVWISEPDAKAASSTMTGSRSTTPTAPSSPAPSSPSA
jgi:nitrate reductase alpha subunit